MPDRFPQEAALRDGRRVLLRRFEPRDTAALYDFFQRLPARVRQFAWDNLEDRNLIETWGQNVDYGKALPILAFENGRIVADATLHRRERGPLRLVGRIKWLLDPEYRGVGLGTLMVNDFISIGRAQGLRHLTCMLIEDLESDAVQTLEDLGFSAHRVPGYGTDPEGKAHDMVKLVLAL